MSVQNNSRFTGNQTDTIKIKMDKKSAAGEYINESYEPDFEPIKTCVFLPQKDNVTTVVTTLEMDDVKKSYKNDYDPYEHREIDRPTTNSETLLHLLKGSLGTGILAMPNAFYHSGYIVGTVGTIIIGLLCTYCIHLLVTSQYILCKRKRIPAMSYRATAEAAMMNGPPILRATVPYVGHVVNIFLLVYQLGICCVYVVFVAANIKSVCDRYTDEDVSIRIYMLCLLLPLILINWVRNLKLLAPFSTAANAVTIVTFGIILYYIFRELPTFDGKEPVGKLEHFPLFFGTVLFALEAIGVIMPLENEMKTPRSFGGHCGILNIGMFTIIILYAGMGLTGYLKYGSTAAGSITLNLPEDDILVQVLKILLALAIFITHALQCYVAIEISWTEYLSEKLGKSLIWEYVIRTGIVIFTFLLAVAIPNLELFISLFGALCLSALGLAFPAIIETSTQWYFVKGPRFAWMMAKNSFLVIFGLLGLVVGTYTSLHEIIKTFQ